MDVARRFIEFMLSEPAQRLWITRADPQHESQEMTLRRLPIRRSVYDHPENFTEYTNPYLAAGDFNTMVERTSEFGLMDELIALSCIDLLPELRETRREILASPRARELDAKLARFPVDEEASRRGVAAYRKMLNGDPREWLDLQRQWLDLFRSEYRGLRELAATAPTASVVPTVPMAPMASVASMVPTAPTASMVPTAPTAPMASTVPTASMAPTGIDDSGDRLR